MKRLFPLLGGFAFAALAAAACLGAGISRAAAFLCAGLGFCTLLARAACGLRSRKILRDQKKLSGGSLGAFLPKAAALGCALLTAALCFFQYARAWETRVAPVQGLDGRTARIRGTVLDYPEEENHKAYYLVEIARTDADGVPRKGQTFTARISTRIPFDCGPGDILECTVKFFTFDSSGGLYCTRNSRLADGVEIGGYLSDYEDFTTAPSTKRTFSTLFAELRHYLGRSFEKRLPGEEAGLIRAILLGETGQASDRVYGDFRRIGASHVLVVSGLHMSVLAGCISSLLTGLLKKKWVCNLLTAGAILVFLVVIGFPVSAVRSGIMYLLYLAADSLGRKADSLNSLGVAVLLICLGNPFSGGDLGFALSVFSTLGIILLGDRTAQGLLRPFAPRPRLRKALAPAASSFGMTLSALLFTLPLQAAAFQGFSLLAPLAGLILVFPCALLLYTSLAAAACSLHPASAPLGDGAAFFAGWLARLVLWAARRLAGLTGAFLDLSNTASAVALGFLLLLGSVLCLARKEKLLSCAAAGGMVLCLCVWTLCAGSGGEAVTLAAAPDSSCVLLLRGDRAAVLSLGGYRTGAAETLLYRCNIRHVEALCLPVSDGDAREAAAGVLETFGADRLVLPEDAYLGRDLMLAGSRSQRVYLGDGDSFEVLGGIRITASHNMARLTVEAGGIAVVVETGETGPGKCDLLITSLEKTEINSTFTVLQNSDTIEENHNAAAGGSELGSALAAFPPGQYAIPGGNGFYIDLFPDGTAAFRGDTRA